MPKMTVRDIDVTNKRVFLRVDFNVPLDEATGEIGEDIRIREALPTIKYLTDRKAKVIICSHLGRPKGVDEKARMTPVGKRLAELLGKPVTTARDCIGTEVEKTVAAMKSGDVLLLENVRFYTQEEKNDDTFARSLSKLADIYVDDAFGAMHRAHASIVGITKYLPAVAGLLVEKELDTLGKLMTKPEPPFSTLIGGAKISDKVAMLQNIMGKLDNLLVGGGLAATFLKAKNYEIGKSLVENDMLSTASSIMQKAGKVNVLLPLDVVVATELKAGVKTKTVPADKIPADSYLVDIGKETIDLFSKTLSQSKTVFWNGPMGIFEIPEFAAGTKAIGNTLAGIKGKGTTVTGGGSTAEAVIALGLKDKFTFVSTGGGASLEFLSGMTLPGVAALQDKK